jgi:hypothetical protein
MLTPSFEPIDDEHEVDETRKYHIRLIESGKARQNPGVGTDAPFRCAYFVLATKKATPAGRPFLLQ